MRFRYERITNQVKMHVHNLNSKLMFEFKNSKLIVAIIILESFVITLWDQNLRGIYSLNLIFFSCRAYADTSFMHKNEVIRIKVY